MNISNEVMKGQISSQKITSNKNSISKAREFGNQSAFMQVFVVRAFYLLKETVISVVIVSGVLMVCKLTGVHSLWIRLIERLFL